jgi:hypothetical protein
MPATRPPLELDHGPQSRGPERFCVATRAVRPVETMIRFVIAPNGEPVPDLKRNLPGRGVWVTGTRTALQEAVQAGAFARGFRRQVRGAADLVGRTEILLETAVLDALAMTRKAGLVVTGLRNVENTVARGPIIALLHAKEVAADTVKKLDGVLRQFGQAASATVIRILSASQLDLALGRPNVVHAALLAGRASDTFMARLRRLERFRSDEAGELGDKPERAAGEKGPTSVAHAN